MEKGVVRKITQVKAGIGEDRGILLGHAAWKAPILRQLGKLHDT